MTTADKQYGDSTPKIKNVVGLTKKQAECLAYIKATIAEKGVAPSYEDMAEGLGLRSKSGVHRLVCALEARGHIYRLPHCARAIAIASDERSKAAVSWDSAALEIVRIVQAADRLSISKTDALRAIKAIANRSRASGVAS